ncbi:DNA RNA endonuclease NUC1, putative [Babesia ovata]|uniref:DNA RNA endonuclease NUC1, putative n=1 Tax=Babesia ovata TaxID=189622 RepID=A0A2H6KFF7_9APIC|nr:DNA RNA endonuclease NUC1, putative [Babesia ovata]GBE61731.1 DNA RNA endonuclease NUC1, putative [Babesia ovata]
MEEDCELCSCSSCDSGSVSSCCSCDTCNCDSESCCSWSSPSECSSCSCSPRNVAQPEEVKSSDLEQIKTFIADIAGLIRQSKEVEVKEPPAPKEVPEAPPKVPEPVVVEKPEPEDPPVTEVPPQPQNHELQHEIAELERIIHRSEVALRNGYESRVDQPVAVPLGEHVPHFVGSPCSAGAATVVATPACYCYTNDNTVGDPFSCVESPISYSAQPTWRSGFDAPPANEEYCYCNENEAESDTDYNELDLDQLHAKMVSLDLMSYMKLVESVLDERVRLAIAEQGVEGMPY